MVSRLDRLVEFRDPLGPAAKQFLPRLQSAFLVETRGGRRAAGARKSRVQFSDARRHLLSGTRGHRRPPRRSRPAGHEARAALARSRRLRAWKAKRPRRRPPWRASKHRGKRPSAGWKRSPRSRSKPENLLVAATLERDQARRELARLGDGADPPARTEIERTARAGRSGAATCGSGTRATERIALAREAASRERAWRPLPESRRCAKRPQSQQEELATKRAEKAGLDERLASAAAISPYGSRRSVANCWPALRRSPSSKSAMAAEQQELARQNEVATAANESLRAERQRLEARKTGSNRNGIRPAARTSEVDDALRTARQTSERVARRSRPTRSGAGAQRFRARTSADGLPRRAERPARGFDRRAARAAQRRGAGCRRHSSIAR